MLKALWKARSLDSFHMFFLNVPGLDDSCGCINWQLHDYPYPVVCLDMPNNVSIILSTNFLKLVF